MLISSTLWGITSFIISVSQESPMMLPPKLTLQNSKKAGFHLDSFFDINHLLFVVQQP